MERSQNDLKTHLRTFASPSLEVRTTQTHNSTRLSYYPNGTTTTGSPFQGFSPSNTPSMRPANC